MLRSHFQAHSDSCWFILKVMDMIWSHCSDEQNKPVTVSCSNVCLHHNHQGICRSCVIVNGVGIGMGSAFPRRKKPLLILCLEHWFQRGNQRNQLKPCLPSVVSPWTPKWLCLKSFSSRHHDSHDSFFWQDCGEIPPQRLLLQVVFECRKKVAILSPKFS